MTEVSVRPATLDDVDFLAEAMYESQFGGTPDVSSDVDDSWLNGARVATREQVLGKVENSVTYVIVAGEERVGRLRLVRTPGRIELAGIQVVPRHRNAGIGRAVISAVLAEAAAIGAATDLQVSKNNPAAERLYARLGFRRGRLEGDDYWMSAEADGN
jgi:ribosomal protein S18 acetylase RimI-like enzyme